MRNRVFTAIGAALALAAGIAACGDDGETASADFPDDDINFIVHADAGGGSDLSSRALAGELEGILGSSIVVENRPGAAGSTAMQYVADADPDGYTIGFAPVEAAMLGHQDYDVDPADYDLLGQIMLGPGVLVVPADSPYDTLDELVQASQETSMDMGSAGAGSIWEVAAMGVAEETGAQFTSVPFDGGAPAVSAVIGGQIDGTVAGAGEVATGVEEGQLKALALLHDEPHPMLPDVPTAQDLGYDIEFGGWGGVYAPPGLPDNVRQTLVDGIEEAAQSDTFVDTISAGGSLPVYKSPQEFTEFVNSEHERFGELLGDS